VSLFPARHLTRQTKRPRRVLEFQLSCLLSSKHVRYTRKQFSWPMVPRAPSHFVFRANPPSGLCRRALFDSHNAEVCHASHAIFTSLHKHSHAWCSYCMPAKLPIVISHLGSTKPWPSKPLAVTRRLLRKTAHCAITNRCL